MSQHLPPYFQYKTKRRGFTLIELSIVLVIIGLIVGGVLTGKSLIRAAELRAIISEKEAFQTASTTFRLKYNCMAGDCANATQFFGTASVCPGDGDDQRTTATCNGNGDKQITHNAAGGGQNESFGFWQHLALAGLIEGAYTGVTDDTSLHYGAGMTSGGNVPKGPLPGSLWSVYYWGYVPIADGALPEGSYGNTLSFGRDDDDNYSIASSIIISPIDAYNIDAKMDDGLPMLGNVSQVEGNPASAYQCFLNGGVGIGPSTTIARAITTTVYNPTKDDIACSLIFRNVF